MKQMIHETNGSLPAGPLVLEPDGPFIGAAFTAGPKGKGVIFRFRVPEAPENP
jgi:hypothetical protein